MFNQIVQWVRRLFGKVVGWTVEKGMADSEKHKKDYEDTRAINFDSIFASSLSNKAVTDCDMTITDANDGESKRSEYITRAMEPVWEDIKKTVAQALGKGGKFLIPYVDGDRVFVDVVDQNKVAITGVNGAGEITSLSVAAEHLERNGKTYDRVIDYALEDGNITIRTRAISQSGEPVPLASVPEWEGITEEITIGNVEKMLVGFLKCPRDSRQEHYSYGVPITYGCDDTKRQLMDCMWQIEREYKAKNAKVFADELMFGKDEKITGDLFKVFRIGGGLDGKPFYEVYDPAIRDSSYYVRYRELCAQLEQEVGTSSGILTRPENRGTTAYEIKSENYDTFCLVSDIRKNIASCLEDVVYSIDVYAEFFGLTPAGVSGDYKVTFDWDTSLIESSSEKFAQLSELESRGLISGARLNSYVTGQSMEDAQAEIDAVAEEKAKTAAELAPEMLGRWV